MVQVAARPIISTMSVASSAASDCGPALRNRRRRPAPSSGHTHEPGLLDVTLLALTIVLGGQCFSWNASLAAGMLPATGAFALVGSAYVVLVFSLAEIASVFPYSGGAYAVARKTLGFSGGFLIGAIDVLAFVTYVSASVLTLAEMIVVNTPALRGLEPLVWLAFFLSATLLQCRSHLIFWRTTALLATVSFVTLLVFCVGSLPHGDLRTRSSLAPSTFSSSSLSLAVLIVRVLPFSAWFFVGVDAVVLISDDIHDPRVTIPRAHRRSLAVITGTAVLTFFAASALSTGLDTQASQALAPLSVGFAWFTSLSVTQATWLSVPPTYATAFGVAWAYGRLLASLAASRLLPRWLVARIQQQTRNNPQNLSRRSALGVGSLLSIGVCVLAHYGRGLRLLSNVSLGLAFLSYSGQTLGYIALRRSQRHALARSPYPSPFGLTGAYASLLVWAFAFVSIAGCQNSGGVELVVILSVVLVLVLYYYLYARHHELFSADERDVVLAAASTLRPTIRAALDGGHTTSLPVEASVVHKAKVPTVADPDGSFTMPGKTSSGSLRMPQLVRAGSKLNKLREEDTHVDEQSTGVHASSPSSRTQTSQPDHGDVLSQSFRNSLVVAVPPGQLRRGGSDGVLVSSVVSSPSVVVLPPVGASPRPQPTVGILSSSGFGRSFLLRHGRLERLREETDRDLRSAVSGLWSERSQRWSDQRGRAS